MHKYPSKREIYTLLKTTNNIYSNMYSRRKKIFDRNFCQKSILTLLLEAVEKSIKHELEKTTFLDTYLRFLLTQFIDA